jgi:hypothetical protein
VDSQQVPNLDPIITSIDACLSPKIGAHAETVPEIRLVHRRLDGKARAELLREADTLIVATTDSASNGTEIRVVTAGQLADLRRRTEALSPAA